MKKLIVCIIALMIIACSILVVANVKLNDKLDATEQELANTQEKADGLAGSLQIEIDKNNSMEETIDDLNLELSIANEKVANMQSTGVPIYFTEEEVVYIAKTVYGEARGCSKIQQSAVVWCILNRVDNGYWGDTIKEVVTARGQFHGYYASNPVTDEIREMVEDVLYRWNMEKAGMNNVGRTLPERFIYFNSDGFGSNRFTTKAGTGEVWTWDCWNPYE